MATNLLTYSRRHWREQGYYVETTEKTIRVGKRTWREDLHGFGDLVAVGEGETLAIDSTSGVVYPQMEYVLIQVTSSSNVAARVKKITEGEETIGKGQWERPVRDVALDFLSIPGHRIVVEGWRKKKGQYVRREVEITKDDLR